ncbi:MAG TPA: hypothetical protein VFF79_13865 [Conexibacter sp.]|jgi:hypothetical protein|nr:hypothetical protein [Conexibacter sp.]
MTSPMLFAIDAEVERSEREAEIARRIRVYAAELYRSDADGDRSRSRDEPPEAATSARKHPHPRAGGGAAVVVPSRDQVRDYVVRHGPVRRAQVLAALGGDPKKLGRKLQSLTRAGHLSATGPASRRAYRAPLEASTSKRLRPVETCTGPDEMLAVIRRLAPVTSQQLHERTGRTYPEIADWGRELVLRELVTFEGEGRTRTWRLAAEPAQGLAREIAAMIAADPGGFDERRLALSLSAPEHLVGIACAELLDRGVVRLTGRGTYGPATA